MKRTQSLITDALVSVFVAAILIQWSMAHGRLALYPAYDDVVYMRSGLLLYRDFSDSIHQFFHNLCYRPPHAPVTELLAAVCYAVFGLHDWAPYAGNALYMFIALRIMRQIMSQTPAIFRWLLVVIVLTLPFADELIFVFRPDLFYGVALGATLLYVVMQPVVAAGRRRWVHMGLIFGALLLIKTSTYPQTIAMVGLAVVLRSIRDLFGPDERQPFRRIVLAWATVVAIAVALASTHYFFAFHNINSYIAQTLFGTNSELWKVHTSLSETLSYYIFNTAMLWREERVIWPLFLILGIAAIALTSRSRRWEFGSLLLVLLATYALPTWNQTKSAYLGVCFQVLAVWSMLAFANELFHQARLRKNWAGIVLQWTMPVVCLIALWQSLLVFAWPSFSSRNATVDGVRNNTVKQLFDSLHANYAHMEYPRLTLTTVGDIVNPDIFKYLALKEDDKSLETMPSLFTFDPATLQFDIEQSDFVIAATPGTGEVDNTMDSALHADASLALVQARSDLKQLAAVPTIGGGKFYLFVKLRSLLAWEFAKFEGFDSSTGLTEPRGPYPQYNLPQSRLGLDLQTTLEFTATSTNRMILDMNVRAMPAGQILTVILNGQQVAQFPSSQALFIRHSFQITPKIGTNQVQIQYTTNMKQGKEKIAVMYEGLRIIAAADSVHQ
jgi:hypothetical protein